MALHDGMALHDSVELRARSRSLISLQEYRWRCDGDAMEMRRTSDKLVFRMKTCLIDDRDGCVAKTVSPPPLPNRLASVPFHAVVIYPAIFDMINCCSSSSHISQVSFMHVQRREKKSSSQCTSTPIFIRMLPSKRQAVK